MPELSSAGFVHSRVTESGIIVSICGRCGALIGGSPRLEVLRIAEDAHRCSAGLRRKLPSPTDRDDCDLPPNRILALREGGCCVTPFCPAEPAPCFARPLAAS